MDPLRVVRCQHLCFDPELRKVGSELQRPLDAATAGRREVKSDQQDPQRRLGDQSNDLRAATAEATSLIAQARAITEPTLTERG